MMRPWMTDLRLLTALIYIVIMGCIGLLADQIASRDGIIPFGPHEVTAASKAYSSPGTLVVEVNGHSRVHLLGTDQLGRDVASRLIHGITIAFKVGIMSSILVLLIGIILGALAGYIGDSRHRISWHRLLWWSLGIFMVHFQANQWAYREIAEQGYLWHWWTYLGIVVVGFVIILMIDRLLMRLPGYQICIAWDTIVMRLLEVFRSIPRLFLLLAIFAIVAVPSVVTVIVVIALVRWPSMTRIIRAEVMKVSQENFIKSARLAALPDYVIVLRHVLPMIYKPILVLTAINMGTAILIESSLSFLNIGLPIGEVSWGRMLGDARYFISAWWVAIGPGILIFTLILAFNVVGDRLAFHLTYDGEVQDS